MDLGSTPFPENLLNVLEAASTPATLKVGTQTSIDYEEGKITNLLQYNLCEHLFKIVLYYSRSTQGDDTLRVDNLMEETNCQGQLLYQKTSCTCQSVRKYREDPSRNRHRRIQQARNVPKRFSEHQSHGKLK